MYLPRSDSRFGCTPRDGPPYLVDRVTVWCEAHGPARVRSNLAAVTHKGRYRGSIDRLDSVERLPLRTSLWEGDGCKVNFWGFSREQQHMPAIHSPWLCRFGFCVLKQKYRTLHPGGNKQANVQYYSVKNKLSLTFLDAFASHSIVNSL